MLKILFTRGGQGIESPFLRRVEGHRREGFLAAVQSRRIEISICGDDAGRLYFSQWSTWNKSIATRAGCEGRRNHGDTNIVFCQRHATRHVVCRSKSRAFAVSAAHREEQPTAKEVHQRLDHESRGAFIYRII